MDGVEQSAANKTQDHIDSGSGDRNTKLVFPILKVERFDELVQTTKNKQSKEERFVTKRNSRLSVNSNPYISKSAKKGKDSDINKLSHIDKKS